jgi:ABC-type bacteriocin/lantibiotic exporter with double-glycine peptidase domain
MGKLLNCPYIFFLQKGSDIIINALSNSVRYAITAYATQVVNFFAYIVILIMLFSFVLCKFLYPALMTIVFVAIFIVIQSKILKYIGSAVNSDIADAGAENTNILQQSIMAIKEIKALNTEECIFHQFFRTSSKVSRLEQLGIFIQGVPSFVTETFVVLTISILCCLMVLRGLGNHLVTNLGLIAVVFFRLAPVLNRMSAAYGVIKAYAGSVESLNREYKQVLNKSLERVDLKQSTLIEFSKTIRLKNIEFVYESDGKFSLSDINLTINRGDYIGVIGASGSGKTTLVDVILGLLNPTAGEYYIDDIKVSIENTRHLTKLFGYVPQSPYIFPGTIAKNIALGQKDTAMDYEKIREVMKMAQLEEFDPDKTVMEAGKTLSGGQKQRIAMARALYRNPKVLILDEATSALDVQTEYQIRKVIEGLRGKVTVITVTHRVPMLGSYDKIVCMDNGKIIDTGTFNELKMRHLNLVEMVEIPDIS